jgi:replicative DNA helicase
MSFAPPHNLQAERALLGALLINNQTFERVAELVREEHFFDPLHGRIFTAVSDLISAGRLANPVTMRGLFGEEEVGDVKVWQYLGTLVASATSLAGVKDYAHLLVDLSVRRALIILGEDIAALAVNEDVPAKAQIADIEQKLYGLAERGHAARETTLSAALDEALRSANAAYANKGEIAGVKTGLADLDEKCGGGLQNSDLVVLAGRPSMGKTALATNIAFHAARPATDPQTGEMRPAHVHFFSQEMSAAQLAMRILAQQSEVSGDRLRRGNFNQSEFSRAMQEAQRMADRSMTIDETGAISLSQLMTKARRVKRQKRTTLVVIDYIQLMQASRRENRTQDITEITMGLKALAKELDVPVLALSQLSRGVERRDDKRPQLSDLRESGSIEQDADVVMFVYRDDYYLERSEPDVGDLAKYVDWQDKMARSAGKAEVILAKQRHGSTGIVHLAFNAKLTQFCSLARDGEARHAA